MNPDVVVTAGCDDPGRRNQRAERLTRAVHGEAASRWTSEGV
jgi:hypothetical protein